MTHLGLRPRTTEELIAELFILSRYSPTAASYLISETIERLRAQEATIVLLTAQPRSAS